MPLPELRELDRERESPGKSERTTALLGGVQFDAPNGETAELWTVLHRADEGTFGSHRERRSTHLTNLDDRRVGRRHIDDRSGAHARTDGLSF